MCSSAETPTHVLRPAVEGLLPPTTTAPTLPPERAHTDAEPTELESTCVPREVTLRFSQKRVTNVFDGSVLELPGQADKQTVVLGQPSSDRGHAVGTGK